MLFAFDLRPYFRKSCLKLSAFQEIIGEILGGLLIGLTGLVSPNKELSGIVELAVFLLIFAAGLEMNLKDIFSAIRKKALICALVSFILSFTAGIGVAFVIGLKMIPRSGGGALLCHKRHAGGGGFFTKP